MASFLFQCNMPTRLFRLLPEQRKNAFEVLSPEKSIEWMQLAEAHGAHFIATASDGTVRRLVSANGVEIEVPDLLNAPSL